MAKKLNIQKISSSHAMSLIEEEILLNKEGKSLHDVPPEVVYPYTKIFVPPLNLTVYLKKNHTLLDWIKRYLKSHPYDRVRLNKFYGFNIKAKKDEFNAKSKNDIA